METLFQQAVALHRAERLEEAETLYRQVIDWRQDSVLNNLGLIYRVTGRLEEAEAALRGALKINGTKLSAQHSLGMTLLQQGRYAEGWRHYEARLKLHPKPAPPPLPEWRGESLAGKRLVVVAEQGFGDQILLSRFLGLTGADEVAFATSHLLAPLLSALPAEVFYPSGWDGIRGDYFAYIGSVPRWLELGPRDAPAPYLPSPARVTTGVGLMLEGAAANANNAQRLPDAATAQAIRALAPFVDLSPEASGARDFAETAEIVAGLDRVVTVDTAVAHLAGAMGKACWVLLPRRAIDWYANWRDDRTPWYPSLRTIRQRRPGDWAGVISDLAGVLAQPAP